jgi:hypothetical protein
VYGQFPTALRFALRNQTRNRLAALLLVAFVPIWYLLMQNLVGHQTLTFTCSPPAGSSASTAAGSP